MPHCRLWGCGVRVEGFGVEGVQEGGVWDSGETHGAGAEDNPMAFWRSGIS